MKLTANGIEIHYAFEGEGPVVTLGHALGTNLSMWDEQARALNGRYRVLRFDTRGHGQTSAPPGPYALEQLAEDVHGLLTGLRITETHFVGLSMGGMIGQIFALKYPQMVRSLVLCDTTSRYPAGGRAGHPAVGLTPVQHGAARGVQPGAAGLPRQGDRPEPPVG